MIESKYKVGDVVTIRQWDDMLEEYGYHHEYQSVIDVRFLFTSSMRRLCGDTFIIANVMNYGSDEAPQIEYFLKTLSGKSLRWSFSDEMFVENSDYQSKEVIDIHLKINSNLETELKECL